MLIRLDKYLADMGIGTRSNVKSEIKKGKITVNGAVCKDANVKIDSDNDEICFDGKQIVYEQYEYFMLNKPAGIISAATDNKEKTVVDLITDKKKKDLFPIGRLDKDTEGLILISNDGELSHNLLSPKKHVDKTYYVELDKVLSDENANKVCQGVFIEKDVKTLLAQIERISNDKVYLTIHEGKFHQVKKMFHAVGCEVTYLKRMSMGSLKLDESLKPGEYRALTSDEIKALKENI